MPHGFPKVFIAAVGEAMTEMCGEVADGLPTHAFTTRRYAEEVTTPALLAGLQRAGRGRSGFQASCPVFVVTGETAEEMAVAAAATRNPRRIRWTTSRARPLPSPGPRVASAMQPPGPCSPAVPGSSSAIATSPAWSQRRRPF
jgi:alkanesulfonate monooxygenase SsuD/methylene tetrahydromethanopterin reductase-like flavin-dependent oxidoreductase (luciferase family)